MQTGIMTTTISAFGELALRTALTGLVAASAVMAGCATTTATAPPVPSGTARVAINSPASREQLATLAQVQSMQRELAELRRALARGQFDTDAAVVARNDSTQCRATDLPTLSAAASDKAMPVMHARAAPAELVEFDILANDMLLANALTRWGRIAGYEVMWNSPIEARVTGASTVLAPDFKGALGKTVQGLQQLGYPLRALVYSDRVVRIVNKE